MLRSHWALRRRDRKAWRWEVERACGRCHPPIVGKVRLEITVYRQSLQDPDNAYASVKHVVDALVEAGWLHDDSPEFRDLEVTELVEWRPRWRRTVVKWMPSGPNCAGPGALAEKRPRRPVSGLTETASPPPEAKSR